MSFLAPAYLLLAAAALVPMVIHLLRRRSGSRLDFPATRYLERAQQQHRRTLRLRNLLLMLLRVAAVVALTLAAARPMARILGSGHAPTAIAIVVDNSMSSGAVVGGARVLDQLKAAGSDLLHQMNTGDRGWLITADGVVRGGSPDFLADALQRLEPLGGAGDPRAALVRAAGVASASGFDAHAVALLTDAQQSSWHDPVTVTDARVLALVAPGEPPVNRAVGRVAPSPQRWTPRGSIVAQLRSADSVAYLLTIANRVVARGTASPGEGITVTTAPSERGWVAGSLEIAADELSADNVRHVAVWIGAPTGVQLTASAGPFLESAVDVLRASARVTIGSDVRVGEASDVMSLPALILAPTDPVRVGAANRALERLDVPWRFGTRTTARGVVRGGALDGTNVVDRYTLLPRPGASADTLAAVDGSPWIVAGSRYVIIGSPMTDQASGLPTRATFVSWVATMLTERLSAEPPIVMAAAPGARIATPPGIDAIETPKGGRTAVGGTIDLPAESGVTFLLRGGRRTGAIVANAPPEESELSRLTADELKARIHARETIVESSAPRWSAASFAIGAHRSLIQPMLLAALIALLGESVVLFTRARRVTP